MAASGRSCNAPPMCSRSAISSISPRKSPVTGAWCRYRKRRARSSRWIRRMAASRALTGGFDYFASNYNRAVQAKRQPGSSFKPFLYSAALDQGFTPASIINDAPLVIEDPTLEGSWRPQNNTREFRGPMRLREALVRSRNLVSIRVMNSLGPAYATQFIERFGFPENTLAAKSVAGSGHRAGIAVGDGERLLGVCERRLPRRALFHSAHRRYQRQDRVRGRAEVRVRRLRAADAARRDRRWHDQSARCADHHRHQR